MNRSRFGTRLIILALLVMTLGIVATEKSSARSPSGYTVIGWNNLGMHCMDADYSVFSILPPYNVLQAQLVDAQGKLVTNPAGVTLSYEAVEDPARSFNSSSAAKTNFWEFVGPLYGATPPVDTGLAGAKMPGPNNVPQPMAFDASNGWWIADGIPITPKDDRFAKNSYPLMRVVARDGSGTELAHTDVVLPVSDEMDCRACHASGSGDAARPKGGWIYVADPQIDYRENILLLHDDRQLGNDKFRQALSDAGYDPAGLWATYSGAGTPILCAKCHASNALPGTGLSGIAQLTHSMHAAHSTVIDPLTGFSLGNSQNRAACYRCHPGSTTRCLRGAMGRAVANDGSMAMQCQSCHGSMSQVGANTRPGWFDEPSCGNCHTGSADRNNGQIRYLTAYENNGARRVPLNDLFNTNPDTPAAGLSLYRFSHGHGGLSCESCHGATHAEYPSLHSNDNQQSIALQGHAGLIADCTACHAHSPQTTKGGPHGMHPIGDSWISSHGDIAEGSGQGQCQGCHGQNLKGSVLSRSLGNRQFRTSFGTKQFWQGFQISCWACHNGPSSEHATLNHPAQASDLNATAWKDAATQIALQATDRDKDPLSFRIVTQPEHGTVGLSGSTATYYPDPGFTGPDRFSYSAWDGKTDSNLANAQLQVQDNLCTLSCSATVPSSASEGSSLSFIGSATASGCVAATSYLWEFGDGATSSSASSSHAYAHSGSFAWTFTARADGASCSRAGSISVAGLPPSVSAVRPAQKGTALLITGSNIHSKVEVTIAGSAWTQIVWKDSTQLLLKGPGLMKRFPKNSWVRIVLTNPDDGLAVTIEYNRSLKQFRVVN